MRFFSDAKTGLVFSFGRGEIHVSPFTNGIPPTFIYGQRTAPNNFKALGRIQFLIVVFQPWGMFQLTGIPAWELRDRIIDAADVFGPEILYLCSRLASMDLSARIAGLNDFLSGFFHGKLNLLSTTRNAIHLILARQGVLPVRDLACEIGVSQRKLQRDFLEHVGISPKKFSVLVRVHAFLASMDSPRTVANLTGLSHHAGFYDQAHAIREFRKLTGVAPGEYARAKQLLAVNFLVI